MKRIWILLLCVLLLCGCAQNNAENIPSTDPVVTEETIPVTEPEKPHIVDVILSEMTLEEKVGQLFLVRYADEYALEDITACHLGGFVLFGKDFKNRTPEEAALLIKNLQSEAKIPLLIAVDEEGGIVTRVSSYSQYRSENFPSPRNLYDAGGIELVEQTETEKCQLLKRLGINVNLAPVCDITTDPNAFMYRRSLGQDPQTTGQYIASVLAIMQENQMGGVLKHFPGYGNNTDTHIAIAVDERPLEELESRDLIPFQYGIRSGCDAIMVSHTFVNCLDSEYPASLSAKVHQYIRLDMAFDGVITTDDLVMQAITDLYGHEEAAVMAVEAGNDLLCCTEYQIQYEAVLEAVRSGRLSESQIDQSVRRILFWKFSLGLIPEP